MKVDNTDTFEAIDASREFLNSITTSLTSSATPDQRQEILKVAAQILEPLNDHDGRSNLVTFCAAFTALDSVFAAFKESMEEYTDESN